MTALRHDLYIEQGAVWPGVAFTILQADGSPVTTLAGFSARGQVRSRPGGTALFTWDDSPAMGEGLITLVGDQMTLSATAAQTGAMTFCHALWDVELTDPTGEPARIAQGSVTVDPDITRAP